ncbi:MAG TPA: HAMP domain-containing sensor histidine kinase [Micromonosporaceae bacterium]|nr:HAMP domain-containing sensor histidine kinase [Micromonosporaceae bacterium]
MRTFLRRTPLRVKLVAAVLSLVALALVVIAVTSALFLRQYLTAQIDDSLEAASQRISAVGHVPIAGELPSDYVVVVWHENKWAVVRYAFGAEAPVLPRDPADAKTLAGDPYTVGSTNGKPHWRMLATALPDGSVFLIGEDLSTVDKAVARLIWIDVLVGLGVLIVLATVGAAIVRRSLRPLVDIERTAAAIGAGDLTRRVPDFEGPDADEQDEPNTEVGRLARALNAMLAQIEAAFTARAASETAALSAESAARDAAVAAQVSEARARRSEERMRQFVADASHELRTPLTTIRGFAELHRQGAARGEEETAKLIRRIEDEAARMGLLVEDLLLLARLDRERPVELAPVELPVIAADAVQAAGAVAPGRRVTLDVANDAGPLVVLGDDARLRQIVGNLTTNALTHTPQRAPITVRLYRLGDEAVLEVADGGPGLSPEQVERVFERFYRTDAARTRTASGSTGTGLGLAIVAALVAAHSGSVEVDSRPGEGTTFRVRLPLAPEVGEADENGDSQPTNSGVPG